MQFEYNLKNKITQIRMRTIKFTYSNTGPEVRNMLSFTVELNWTSSIPESPKRKCYLQGQNSSKFVICPLAKVSNKELFKIRESKVTAVYTINWNGDAIINIINLWEKLLIIALMNHWKGYNLLVTMCTIIKNDTALASI